MGAEVMMRELRSYVGQYITLRAQLEELAQRIRQNVRAQALSEEEFHTLIAEELAMIQGLDEIFVFERKRRE